MKPAELITRLARLDAQDRAWLLGELPPALRRELVAILAAEDAATPDDERAEDAATLKSPAGSAAWEALDPERVAGVLDGEPAWLASAATRGTEPRWREKMLHALPARRRHEIEIADRSGTPLGARARQLLLEGCRERLAEGPDPSTATVRGGFAALLDQMRSRFA